MTLGYRILIAAVLLAFSSELPAQTIGPVSIPPFPDGATWQVTRVTEYPGTAGNPNTARGNGIILDRGNGDGTWMSGEPLEHHTFAIAYADLIGTTSQSCYNHFRIPFSVENDGAYRAGIELDIEQQVSTISSILFLGYSRAGYVVANRVQIIAVDSGPETVIYSHALSYHDEVPEYGDLLTSVLIDVLLEIAGRFFLVPDWAVDVLSTIDTIADFLESFADPAATFEQTHGLADTIQLRTGTQYYLSIQSESDVFAQMFGLGFQWASSKTKILLNEFSLEEVNPATNVPPTIEIVAPVAPNERADELYLIRWCDSDPDSNATIELRYDTDTEYSGDEPLITDDLFENDQGLEGDSFAWDTSGVGNGTYYIVATIDDGLNSSMAYSPGTVRVQHPIEQDNFSVVSITAEDDAADADGDGVMESGESCSLQISLRNENALAFEFVRAILVTETPGVDITDSRVSFGTFAGGSTSTGEGDFDFDPFPGFVGTAEFVLEIRYESAGVQFIEFETIDVEYREPGAGPVFMVDHVEFDDSEDGDGNGALESGEDSIRYKIHVKNCGTAVATEVKVEVCDVAEIELGDRDEQYPSLPANCSAAPPSDNDDFYISQIPVNFTGTVTTDVKVTYGPGEVVQVIEDYPLFDVGPAAWFLTLPREKNFGVRSPGQRVDCVIQVRNLGTAPLTIPADGIEFSHTDMHPMGISLPYVLQPGTSTTFTAAINTDGLEGFIERTITVNSDARLGNASANVTTITGLVSGTCPDTRLTTSMSSERYPDVDGDLIVWEDGRNGNLDIFAFDLEAGVEFAVATGPQRQLAPRASENYIAWMVGDIGSFDVYAYDVSSGVTIPIATGARDERLLGIDGDRVAFSRDEHTISNNPPSSLTYGIYNLFYYDISEGSEIRVTNFVPNGFNTVFGLGSLGDFDSGLIIFGMRRHVWSGTFHWTRVVDSIQKYEIGVDGAPCKIRNGGTGDPSTDAGRVVWDGDDDFGNLDDYHVWLWDDSPDCSTQVTRLTKEETNHDWQAVIGGNYIVYRKSSAPGLYYWDLTLGGERAATTSPSVDPYSWRINGSLLVWADNRDGSWDIYYKYLDAADVAVTPSDIQPSIEAPGDGEPFDVDVTVNNIGCRDRSGNVTVQLFDGDPDQGGAQIGGDQVISGGIVAESGREVTFPGVSFVGDGEKLLCVRLIAPDDPPGNNKACRTLQVWDGDTLPPVISNVTVTEHNGDGDGLIEDDEQVKIAWNAADDSGVASALCTVHGTEYEAQGMYEVIVGPFLPGECQFMVMVTDGDDSPESAEHEGAFQVVIHAPVVELPVSPECGATDVSLSPTIEATFNTSLDPVTVNESTVIFEDSSQVAVAGSLNYDDASTTIEFALSEELRNSETYTLTLKSGPDGIKDENGNELENDFVCSFSTEADTTSPAAILSSPAQGAEVDGVVAIEGTAWDANFTSYRIEQGIGCNPGEWINLTGDVTSPVLGDELATWNTANLAEGVYTIRLTVIDAPPASNSSEARVCVTVIRCASASITSEPKHVSVCPADVAIFDVDAIGDGLTYQWQFGGGTGFVDMVNGGDVSGATTSTLTIADTEIAYVGSYRCIVAGDCGAAVTSAAVSLNLKAPPSIIDAPTDLMICPGLTANIDLAAEGERLSYQWQFNGGGGFVDLVNGDNISGATTSMIEIDDASTGDAGAYRCVVTGECGFTSTSASASLVIQAAPAITSQPTDALHCPGDTATFSVGVLGAGLTYQWQIGDVSGFMDLTDGGRIAGATTPTLEISNVTEADGGTYRCRVSGDCGNVNSNPVAHIVNVIVPWYLDSDGDGFGDPAVSIVDCSQPAGYVGNDEDCDDRDPEVNPDAQEICDGLDNDCNRQQDEGGPQWYRDADGDGFGDPDDSLQQCDQPDGYVENDMDCNDACSECSPNGVEVSDGLDNDCNRVVDDVPPSPPSPRGNLWYRDADGDGFGDPSDQSDADEPPAGYVGDGTDCDDTNPAVNPDATETCDGIDNNCDGRVDPFPQCCEVELCGICLVQTGLLALGFCGHRLRRRR
ncbi:MAG: Ig-like domain-containing protein [Phycisphaerales bacterium]|nr:Ig-like domain-containing protein [Phycisphaerales bacterium]